MQSAHARETYLAALCEALGARFYYHERSKAWCICGGGSVEQEWDTPPQPALNLRDAQEQAISLLETMGEVRVSGWPETMAEPGIPGGGIG
jgi:hypothetical protein